MQNMGLRLRVEAVQIAKDKDYQHYLLLLKNYVSTLSNDQFNNELSELVSIRQLNLLLSVGLSRDFQRYLAIHEGLLRSRP